MIPFDIGPHPDAPNHYVSMGKPKDWNEADCGTLNVRRVAATGDLLSEPAARVMRQDMPSGDTLYPCFVSGWTPTPEERARLLAMLIADEPIQFRTLVAGNGLPPMSIWLRAEGEV